MLNEGLFRVLEHLFDSKKVVLRKINGIEGKDGMLVKAVRHSLVMG